MIATIRRIALGCFVLSGVALASFGQTTEKDIGNYTYDGSGNVQSVGPDSAGLTNLYEYDAAGRLIRFVRKNVGTGSIAVTEMFEYDAYGNLTKQTTNGVATTLNAVAATNRLSNANYDAAGNMVAYGAETYTFDPVGTLTRKTGSWGNAFYVYTADDERVGIEGPDGTWRYIGRDVDGKVLREWSAGSGTAAWAWVEDYVYRDGQLAAAVRPDAEGGVRHFHLDHLGSPRLITGPTASIYAEHQYAPYGREMTSPTQELALGHDTPEPMKFTSHERDFAGTYTGPVLDYMHARYYNPQTGRFLSVDPSMDVAKNMAEPQRWNRYSYVTNNPMKYDDPDGRERRILLLSFHTPSEMRLPLILEGTPAHSKGIDSGYSIDARHSLGGKSLLHALGDIDNSGTDIAVINSHGGIPLQTDTGGGADGSRRFSFGAADIAKNLGGRPQAIVLAGCGTMDSAQAVANATGTTVFGIRSGAESYAHQISRAGTVLANVYAATGNAQFAITVANKMLKQHCPSNGGSCSGVPEFQVVQPARQ